MRPGPRTRPIVLSLDERRHLEDHAERADAPFPAHRARIILACADGLHNRAVASMAGVTANTVTIWRNRFLRARLDGLRDVPRRTGVRPLTSAQVEQVVTRTVGSAPLAGAAWSTYTMAQASGLSPSSISRIWRAFQLQRRK